jgi:hypothetical protein
MHRLSLLVISFFTLLAINGCSRKHHPAKTENLGIVKTDSITANRVIKKKRNLPPPKVIVVNDNVARKSVDGRLYYDLQGHRYWKNYKNGKYYLFNQSMYSDDAFRPN